MDEVKVIEIKKSIFAENDKDADALRKELKDRGVYLLNLMSSPGSGKTTTLIKTINLLKDKLRNAMILSVPEGDDKPLKYPLMFSVCDVVIINKTDVLPYFDFDMERCREYIRMRNPHARVFPVCARSLP